MPHSGPASGTAGPYQINRRQKVNSIRKIERFEECNFYDDVKIFREKA